MNNCPDCKHDYEPKEKPQTAGEKWVNTVKHLCLLYESDNQKQLTSFCCKLKCADCRPMLAKAIDIFRASAEPTPEPPAETAFQKAARIWLSKSLPNLVHDDEFNKNSVQTVPWDRIENYFTTTIPTLRVFRGAVLDEAIAELKRQCYSPGEGGAIDILEALKAK